ncbi:MAG: hypothetical protein FJZ96_04445 [Chloroflexi bacterium]|nr:hypothetical protein [Chloroflexota bacterium]
MTVAEILSHVKFVVNPKGNKSAVVLDMDIWEQILTLLEDAEDADEMRKAFAVKEEIIPWNVAKEELKLGE